KGITGIRFAKHQKCYIRTQTKELPNITELESGDAVGLMEVTQFHLYQGWANMTSPDAEEDITATEFEDSQVWVPAEEPIENRAFLLDSKIFEVCETLPIHWIHPLSLKDAEFHDIEDVELSKDDEAREDSALLAKPNGNRKARDITDHLPVNDYTVLLVAAAHVQVIKNNYRLFPKMRVPCVAAECPVLLQSALCCCIVPCDAAACPVMLLHAL
ncbi:tenomodulin isoform X1, partial [Acipenser oxyrinchus oxyrinchus]